jgi:hypothetical protein
MRLKQSLSIAAFAFLAAHSIGGCKSSTPADTPTAIQPATTPSGQPTSAAPASSNTAVAPAPAAPLEPTAVKLTALSGARVSVSINQQLSASRNEVGDPFSGVLTAPLKTSSGDIVFPRGAKVHGTVVAAKGRGRFKGAGALGIEVSSIDGHAVRTSEYEKEQKGKGKRTAGFIGGGAGGGALIGGLAGGGKGALLGGLIGAGAGTAGAAFTGNKDVIIPSESVVVFRLAAPVTVNRTTTP